MTAKLCCNYCGASGDDVILVKWADDDDWHCINSDLCDQRVKDMK